MKNPEISVDKIQVGSFHMHILSNMRIEIATKNYAKMFITGNLEENHK